MSATPESTLADPERRIADLQRQLTERTAERDTALQRETATAEVLQVINSSAGDLAPVFEAILDKALSLCQASYGGMYVLEGERFRSVARRGASEAFIDFMRNYDAVPGANSGIGRVMRGERVVHVHDTADDEAYRRRDPIRVATVELLGARTCIFVGLFKDDTPIGVLTAHRTEVRPFTDKQIGLLQNFAAQAVIAMENARLITETREALEQQTATAEVLGVINSSPGDLTPVFDTMLVKALRLCEATFGGIATYDGEFFHQAATRNEPEAFREARRAPWRPGPQTATGRLARGEALVHTPDVTADEIYLSGDPHRRSFADLTGARTAIWVALRKDDKLLGFVAAYRTEVRPFSDKQIALLENFAAQAVIAMENARLLGELRQRTSDLQESLEYQTATSDVLQVISRSTFDLQPVLDTVCATAARLCAAQLAGLVSRDGDVYRVAASYAMSPEWDALQPILSFTPGRETVTGRALLERQVVQIADITADPEYALSEAKTVGKIRTILGVPLLREGEPVGVIVLSRQRVEPFTERQIELVRTFADQAVIAIENTRLINEIRESLAQQTATAEVLQVINSSPGDLTPVFDAMLEKAVRLCDSAFGMMSTWDGERIHRVAWHGISAQQIEAMKQSLAPAPGTPGYRIARGEDVVCIADLVEEAAAPPTLMQLGGRSYALVALRHDGKLIGGLTIFRREVRPFTDKEIALLRNFAAQAVIAMENARLLGELRQRTDEIAGWNRELEVRVAEQVEELGRVGRLKRFLAPQLAELIVSQGDEKILESHRREIVVVFCDLRGYTAFTETAEPEEVLDFLREYHGALGPLVSQFEGTLDQFSGDGIMVFFNDPVPIPDPAERAVKMAVAMREAARALIAVWRRRDRELGFGVGIAQGYATLGQIGFAERSGYTAIGTVCNLAARLCAEAKDGQILISGRIAAAIEKVIPLEDLGSLALKGLRQPASAFNVPLAATQPALRVIEGGGCVDEA